MPTARGATVQSTFANATAWRYYKLVFPELRDAPKANAMRIAEATLLALGAPLSTRPFGTIELQPTAGISIGGSAESRVVTGNLYAVHRFLTTAGNVRFTGAATQLEVAVTAAQTARPQPVGASLVTRSVTVETWSGIAGTALTALTASPLYPNLSSEVRDVELKPVASDGSGGFYVSPGGDNYGARISGYLAPTETNRLNLYLTADDSAELWVDLSGDGSAALTRVALVNGAVGAGDWTRTAVQKSTELLFERGKLYRFQLLLKEGGGGDYARVGYSIAGQSTIRVVPDTWLVADTPASRVTMTVTAPAGGLVVAGGSNLSGDLARSPDSERAANAIDGRSGTKYLNFDGPGSGLVFSAQQPVVADALRLVSRTNDDIWQWDPKRVQIWGSNSSADWQAPGW
ncbi:MAG: hypothetical protein EB027_07280, partial [Actinobacteria bacterium]|nr:hypothetical protein [Actinomycetota bacterium]